MSAEQSFLDIISGRRSDPAAVAARAGLAVVEPLYAGLMIARNKLFSGGMKKTHRAARPVISIGNITTGGTGKTPVVHWLVEQLISAGRHPAVLMRGYKAAAGMEGDEQRMLRQLFQNGPAAEVVVHANPDRVAGAAEIVRDHPEADVIVLDDGFQHRRLARDFDLVLIDATNPFGFNRIIPRGLLREPLTGLGRADAIVMTRTDLATENALADIERTIRVYQPAAPIYRSSHVLDGFISAVDESIIPRDQIRGRNVFAFCGIGNPESFYNLLRSSAVKQLATRSFPDHHPYQTHELSSILSSGLQSGSEVLITTEKDWAKICSAMNWKDTQLPLYRTRLRIGFSSEDALGLLSTIQSRIEGK